MLGSMATKVPTHQLRIGMFVADLDRPWVDTPFLLQGFLIEDAEQIAALRSHCEFVIVDRARSVGDEYEAPAVGTSTIPPTGRAATTSTRSSADPGASTTASRASTPPPAAASGRAPAREGRVLKIEEVARRGGRHGPYPTGNGGNGADEEGVLGRMVSGFRGLFAGKREKLDAPASAAPPPEPAETPAEFEARASLLPQGVQVQTYVNQTTV